MTYTFRFVCAAMLLALLMIPGCTPEQEQASAPKIRPVVTYTVPDILRSREWSTSGTAENSLATPLSFRVGGTVVELPVRVGQKVAKGDTLAVLDPTDSMLELRSAEAGLKDLQAELSNARTNYQRVKALVDQEVVSRSEYDQALAQYDSIKAKVAKQRDQVSLAKRTLSYTRLTAPQAGTINNVAIERHSNVSPGEPVVTMSSGARLDISLGIPDKLVPYVKVGDKVRVSFDVFEDVTLAGTVTEVGVAAGESATFPATVSLDKADKRLRSGMVGEVTFDFRQVARLEFVSVPSVAVFGGTGGKRFVWVVSPDSKTVAKRTVEVGLPDEVGLVIHKGLKPGELVVVRGVHSLSEGQQVLLKN